MSDPIFGATGFGSFCLRGRFFRLFLSALAAAIASLSAAMIL
jgi:hypothetical protein